MLNEPTDIFDASGNPEKFNSLLKKVSRSFTGDNAHYLATAITNFNLKFGCSHQAPNRYDEPNEVKKSAEKAINNLKKIHANKRVMALLRHKVESCLGDGKYLDAVFDCLTDGGSLPRTFTINQRHHGLAMMVTSYIQTVIKRGKIPLHKASDLVDVFIQYAELDESYDYRTEIFKLLEDNT
jgi:hypothetical protein